MINGGPTADRQRRAIWDTMHPVSRFGSLPNSLLMIRETPYTTILVFPAVHVPCTLLNPARVGIPFQLGGFTPTFRTLALDVRDLPAQAHNPSLYPLMITRTASCASDRRLIPLDSHYNTFQNNNTGNN